MNRGSRFTVLAGILLFTGLALWWSVWFPYAPQRVRGAIPPRAVMVGEHHDLAADAAILLKNPSLRQSIQVCGGDVEAIDAFMASRFGHWLTKCLGGRYTVTAFEPRSPTGAAPAWMVASWGGVRAQLIRGMMQVGMISGWERLPSRSPIACYVLRTREPGPFLSATVYEGVVLLSYSHDRTAVRRMVRRLAYGQDASRLPADTDLAPDRVQVCWTPRLSTAPGATVAWDLPSAGEIAFSTAWPTGVPVPTLRSTTGRGGIPLLAPGALLPRIDPAETVVLTESDRRSLSAGLGALSGALVLAPSGIMDSMLSTIRDPEMGRLYRETLSSRLDPEGVIAVGLLRDTYSGRLLGIKTPSLVMAVKTRSELDLASELPPLLDRWNAQLGLSLLARERGGDGVGPPAFIIDEARNGIYSSMKASEKPALWQSGTWLFVASNLGAAHAVGRAMSQAAPSSQSDWWSAAEAAPEQCHAWVDFAAAGSALRKLTALYAIVQIAQGQRSGPAMAIMERTRQTVAALEPFGEGNIQLQVGRDAWTLDARVGH
ncbi:MAG: hypothetical protein QGH42_02200 [Kiritimatiellia bacterium]|nr:hypothetical protein [Kiritimatiellia bacterium]MDP6809311.1 hypothetical protein [Kiritimatiellia bacterium]MDP7023049.1 hypothetical protein [Kiritimatiellia bacterium]